MVQIVETVIPDRLNSYLQLIGCLKGIWFDDSALLYLKDKPIGQCLMEMHALSLGVQLRSHHWAVVGLSDLSVPSKTTSGSDLGLSDLAAWFDFISLEHLFNCSAHVVLVF